VKTLSFSRYHAPHVGQCVELDYDSYWTVVGAAADPNAVWEVLDFDFGEAVPKTVLISLRPATQDEIANRPLPWEPPKAKQSWLRELLS
jgi:hypothetical protein